MSNIDKIIIEELERFAEERNMSYTKIAKVMNIGVSTLSEYRKGTYTGDVAGVREKVEDFLQRHQQKMRRIDFSADTEVRKKVFYAANIIKKYVASNAVEQIIESAKIGLIFGRAGIGKTHALMEWVRQYKGQALLITAENGISAVGLIKKIAKELKLDYSGSADTIKERIKDAIRFTETILIIDEGEHLKASIIDIVRSIADQTGVGILIAGTEGLKSKIYSQRKEYEYLYSRAVVNMTLRDLRLEDVSEIVRKFLKNEIDLYTDVELSKLISLINLNVRGSARQLSNLLSLASDIANQNMSEKIDEQSIKAAVTMLAIN